MGCGVLLWTAHSTCTRGCSHFTTVFGHAAPLNFTSAIVPPGSTSTPRLQVCFGSWARFENEASYWNAGQCAYFLGPPRGMFLQISASCTFHGNVLSKAVSVVVFSVANVPVCPAHQYGTIYNIIYIVRLYRADALDKPERLSQKQQPLTQPSKEHCHERYTTLISAKTYLAEVPGSMQTVPRSSNLLRSQTAPNCRSILGVEVLPGGTMAEIKFKGAT
jgi:hypothetical protein